MHSVVFLHLVKGDLCCKDDTDGRQLQDTVLSGLHHHRASSAIGGKGKGRTNRHGANRPLLTNQTITIDRFLHGEVKTAEADVSSVLSSTSPLSLQRSFILTKRRL